VRHAGFADACRGSNHGSFMQEDCSASARRNWRGAPARNGVAVRRLQHGMTPLIIGWAVVAIVLVVLLEVMD
jgi:hypothetical protein